MEQPRSARQGEFRELMDFLDKVFRPGQRGRFIMQRQYPHLFQDRPSFLARSLLVRDQGQIVGSVSVHPVKIRLEDVVLDAGGIGQVATHPERRGEGIMTLLLNHAIERMERKRYPISVLGGDRQRYGWFGWENGGTRTLFFLSPRSVGKPSPAERKLPVERLEMTPSVCRRIREIGAGRPYWVERSLGEIPRIFERTSRDAWGCRERGRFAYLVLGGPRHQARPYERIDEAGGDPELVASMIRVLMARYRLERLAAIAGPNREDVELFRPHSSGWERHVDCMVRIVDLPALLDGLAPLLRRKARASGVRGIFRFRMEGSGQQGVLELEGGPVFDVHLGDREMAALFFGLLPVQEVFPGEEVFLRLGRLLPLPLFLPPLNHI